MIVASFCVPWTLDCGSLLPLLCRQPAAKLQRLRFVLLQNGCPQQAVASKAAAGCRTPKGSHTRGFAAPPIASSC
jgi:hypothetical protein